MTATPAKFWAAKHNDAVTKLWEHVPLEGPVLDPARPALEAWRNLNCAYYDVYNNGACNWGHRRANMVAACKFVSMPVPSKKALLDGAWQDKSGASPDVLETIADAVFVRALAEAYLLENGAAK